MKLIKTQISDVVIIEPSVFEDERGWFMESFNERLFHEKLEELSLPTPRPFVQDNHSCSNKGVIRGLHYQRPPYAQGKLVRVIQGVAFDVAVDIRRNSSTFGKHVSLELSAVNKKMLWIPEGFAHGFVALTDNTQVFYKTTNYYEKLYEEIIRWNDERLAISWPMLNSLVISQKDNDAPSFIQSLEHLT